MHSKTALIVGFAAVCGATAIISDAVVLANDITTGQTKGPTNTGNIVKRHDEQDEIRPGGVHLLYPRPRGVDVNKETLEPCGGFNELGNETPIAMSNGALALLARGEFENLQINIALRNDPKSQDDFQVLVHDVDLPGTGHVCVNLPSEIEGATADTTATLQLLYKGKVNGTDGKTKEKLFFQCADVRLVEDFVPPPMLSRMCFNGTSGGSVSLGDAKNTIKSQEDLQSEKSKLETSGAGSCLKTFGLGSIVIASIALATIGMSIF